MKDLTISNGPAHYDEGQLFISHHRAQELAKNFGTPAYVYDLEHIQVQAKKIAKSLTNISAESKAFYAVKALSNLRILKEINQLGLGMDVVSQGELRRCLKAGVAPSDILFSGVGKTKEELQLGVQVGIKLFNIESPHEISLLNSLGEAFAKKVSVALRFNPDIDGKTHSKITTGLKETKFGLNEEVFWPCIKQVLDSKYLSLEGISCHIGSQIKDLTPIKKAALKMKIVAETLLKKGAPLKFINMGGGLGVAYRPEESTAFPAMEEWVEASSLALPDKNHFGLLMEPGRSIVGQAGVLMTRMVDLKESENHRFVICDAGMTELIRPALYDAYHHILPEREPKTTRGRLNQVVGPVCETSCILGQSAMLDDAIKEEILCVLTSGAYGMSMASTYNSRPRPAEILIYQDTAELIRKRESFEDLWSHELQT